MSQIETLEDLLRRGQDSALLRYGLGNAYLQAGRPEEAQAHFAEAVRQDSGYSAAWKLYGKVLAELGEHEKAIEVFARGIEVAERKGDRQAGKEMEVFRRRSQKALAA